MGMIIRYQNGARVEAVLLAASSERMRVVIGSERDTVELHKADTFWFTEKGDEIEIEALIPMAGNNISLFCDEVYPRTKAAGGLATA